MEENKNHFADYHTESIDVPKSILPFIYQGLFLKSLKKKLEYLIDKQDKVIIYLPAFHYWNLSILRWAAAKANVTTTLTVHDYITHIGEKSRLIERWQKQCINLADKVVCPSRYVTDQISMDYPSHTNLVTELHPIPKVKDQLGLSYNARPKILMLGRMLRYKGYHNLIQACNLLPIESLTLAGQFSKTPHNLPLCVNIIDKQLTENEMHRLLMSHHILALPYLEASQSGILARGIACGCVMVISRVGGLPEQLPEDAAMWVEPDVDSLRRGILRLLEDRLLYQRIKQKMKSYL